MTEHPKYGAAYNKKINMGEVSTRIVSGVGVGVPSKSIQQIADDESRPLAMLVISSAHLSNMALETHHEFLIPWQSLAAIAAHIQMFTDHMTDDQRNAFGLERHECYSHAQQSMTPEALADVRAIMGGQ